MAKRQKKFEEDHSNDWLNTYADMVTLLLTFFVMLYASSSLDDQKWQFIYQAFQSHGKFVNEYVRSPDPVAENGEGVTDDNPNTNGGSGELPQSFDRLYQYLSEYVDENDLSDMVALDQGAAHITIRFDDDVFFDSNSYVLKEEGREVLSGIGRGLKAAQDFILTCSVTGHTAEAISAVNDWELSSLRACSVVNYMEYRTFLPSQKFRSRGYGCTEPIADNSTPEGRAKNRRVEILLVENKVEGGYTSEEMQDIWMHDYQLPTEQFDPDGNHNEDNPKLPDGSTQLIIDSIEERFPNAGSSSIGYEGPIAIGDYSNFLLAADSEPSGADNADDGADGADSE